MKNLLFFRLFRRDERIYSKEKCTKPAQKMTEVQKRSNFKVFIQFPSIF